jgi:tRNA (guanine37-N1)-methyltransferase
VDARLNELFPVEEYSVGDFVLNGGEAAAVCVMEAVSRLVPGFMGHEQSGEEESFSAGLLEYPHYTRPEEYQGRRVPEVLLSGDHRRIAAWRRKQALALTLERRPDLLDAAELGHADMVHLFGQRRRRLGRNLYVALLHHPVRNKRGKTVAVSLTNLDLHDIARCSRANSLGGYYVATPLEDQRRLAGRLLAHWTEGAGAEAIPDRAEALARVRVVESLEEAVARVAERAGQAPRVVATSARPLKKRDMCSFGRVRRWLSDTPVLLVLGTGSGLTAEVLNKADAVLRPLRYMDGYNHFSVRTAAAVMVDRLLGDVY